MRRLLLLLAVCVCCILLAACETTQGASRRYSTRPFNSPAGWEANPYGGQFQN